MTFDVWRCPLQIPRDECSWSHASTMGPPTLPPCSFLPGLLCSLTKTFAATAETGQGLECPESTGESPVALDESLLLGYSPAWWSL